LLLLLSRVGALADHCKDAGRHCSPLPSPSLTTTTPNQFTGLPVVGATGKVVGVISRKDIIDVRRSGGSLQEKVKAHMTSPAITCTPGMPVQEAGALMLKQKIRRLPVVDAEGKPLGCAFCWLPCARVLSESAAAGFRVSCTACTAHNPLNPQQTSNLQHIKKNKSTASCRAPTFSSR
jgi:CBS domain-containing protein